MMGKRNGPKKNTATESNNKEETPNRSPAQVHDEEANAEPHVASLTKVLEEIRDFRKDTKHQLNDIKAEITNVNAKLAEAEMRIENVEDCVQNVEHVLSKMIKSNIRFQTLFPAKLRVFYEDETRLYQTEMEATKDMKDRGLPVTDITPRESLAEQLSRSAWDAVGAGQRGTGEERERNIREKLCALRRQGSSSTGEEL
ncbi:hypothetical protein F2P81_013442 [Scophthalmus maximus]|uniref:Uncharacterized protein n=1 Tax=Scophthalmus maximus TaxID=52904 RepID=A0A6A4SE16_SCOMX|nr:hypothetical protein F2P81_013442 [Scophthalmus maximus]